MAKPLKPEQIDRMADGFVGTGGHRRVPIMGFDPDRQFPFSPGRFPGLNVRPDDEAPGRSAGVGQTPSIPLEPAVGLPASVRELLGG